MNLDPDTWAQASARGDQQMAAIRDNAGAWVDFVRACEAFDDVLRSAGMDYNARCTAIVTTALGTGLTGKR